MHSIWLGCFIELCYIIYSVNSWAINLVKDVFDRECLVVPENEYSTLILKPDKSSCPLPNCWESQLTLVSKANLTWIYNSFRQEVAVKQGMKNVLKIAWHWSLEKEAIDILKSCPTEPRTATMETRDVGGLGYNMVCEETISFLPVSISSQLSFVNFFPQLLRDEQADLLDNFNEDRYFRRPAASHFGCSFMLTGGSAHYIVCVYCAAESSAEEFSIQEELNKCPPFTHLGKSVEFPNLCVHSSEYSVYGCEPANLGSLCTSPKPQVWQTKYDGNIKEWYAVTDGKDSFFVINGTGEGGIIDKNVVECKQLPGKKCPPSLSAWSYVYDSDKLEELNKTVHLYYSGRYITFGSKNTVTKISEVQEIAILPAKCCTYLFFLFLFTAVVAIAVGYFTYKHYVENKT